MARHKTAWIDRELWNAAAKARKLTYRRQPKIAYGYRETDEYLKRQLGVNMRMAAII